MFDPHQHPEGFLGILAGIGALVGIGRLLDSTEKITLRLATGRAITSAGIGAAAGGITLLVPGADSPLVMYALAAGLSSLGTSGLEALMKRVRGGGQ